MKLTCPQCGGTRVKPIRGPYRYTQCGLDYVYLMGITQVRCESCKERVASIPDERRLLESIALVVARSYRPLGPAEIRFLRSMVAWSQGKLAELLAVGRVTVSRWESGAQPLDIHTDVHLRLVWASAILKDRGWSPTQLSTDTLLEAIAEVANRAQRGGDPTKRPRIELDPTKGLVRAA